MTAHVDDHEHSAAISKRVKLLVARLERSGILTERELDETIERFLLFSRPQNGYRMVARAWSDAQYKQRLLADGNRAAAELGIDLRHWAPVKLRVVANTTSVHNVIVCTLCSCYPIALLGPSPSWYKSDAYRASMVRDPRRALREFGLDLPEEVDIAVWDSTADARYMVLPRRPCETDRLSEDELAALVTRDGLIGTAIV